MPSTAAPRARIGVPSRHATAFRRQIGYQYRESANAAATFTAPAVAAGGLPDRILDGERCVVNAEGYSDFSALRSALGARGRKDEPAVFVFDIVFEGGEDLPAQPLIARKARLRTALAQVEHALHNPGSWFIRSANWVSESWSGKVTGQGQLGSTGKNFTFRPLSQSSID